MCVAGLIFNNLSTDLSTGSAGRKSCRRGAADLDVGAQLLLKRETVTAGDFPAIRSVKVATEPPRFGAGVKRVHRISAGALRPGASIGGICLQRYGAAPDRGRPMVCPWQIFNNKSSPATIELNQKRKRSQSYPVMGAIAGPRPRRDQNGHFVTKPEPMLFALNATAKLGLAVAAALRLPLASRKAFIPTSPLNSSSFKY